MYWNKACESILLQRTEALGVTLFSFDVLLNLQALGCSCYHWSIKLSSCCFFVRLKVPLLPPHYFQGSFQKHVLSLFWDEGLCFFLFPPLSLQECCGSEVNLSSRCCPSCCCFYRVMLFWKNMLEEKTGCLKSNCILLQSVSQVELDTGHVAHMSQEISPFLILVTDRSKVRKDSFFILLHLWRCIIIDNI